MYQVKVNNTEYNVKIENNKVYVNDTAFEMELTQSETGQVQLKLPNKVVYPIIEKGETDKTCKVRLDGEAYDLELKDHFDLLLEKMGLDKMMTTAQADLKAPMPGLVLEILATPGETVNKGDALLVLEAMKMENVIKAPSDAVVKEIKVEPKEAVEKNHVLITFE
ncbi:MAG: acetyl-CoA carboxylase biotin carboxyl carrier protein subunit [Bacteroidia bacterium]